MAENVRKAITGLLAADPQLAAAVGDYVDDGNINLGPAIFHRTAPQDAAAPFVLLHKQSGLPHYTFGDHHDDELWTVKAVDRALSAERAEEIDDRIREVLQDAPLDVTGSVTLWCRREQDVDYGEVEEGTLIHHVGAMYRVLREPV